MNSYLAWLFGNQGQHKDHHAMYLLSGIIVGSRQRYVFTYMHYKCI